MKFVTYDYKYIYIRKLLVRTLVSTSKKYHEETNLQTEARETLEGGEEKK